MAITKDDIKLMSSQNLTDFDDGGGVMIGSEIVDGNVNNLFPDISRLDRVYGRVSIRKAFALVDTSNTDIYYGCHAILTDPPDDPLVSTLIFSDNEYASVRSEIQNDIEQYVTQSSRYLMNLMDLHVAGTRGLLFWSPETTETPKSGDVLFIIENFGLSDEISEYVRITDVSWLIQVFTDSSGAYSKKIIEAQIQNPLRNTYTGVSSSRVDMFESGISGTAIYKTLVADAANYYGVSLLDEAITAGELHCKVDSIYKPIVPSAQTETALVDVNAAGNVSVYKESFNETGNHTITVSIAIQNNSKLYTGIGILPGTLTITSMSGYIWTDDYNSNLVKSNINEGTVSYGDGMITFSNPTTYTGNVTISFKPAVSFSRINNTMSAEVTISTRAYTYVKTLMPVPDKCSVIVDFMALGNWYRLRDNGQGILVPEISGAGSGTINYDTGTVSITCGALPDVDSHVMFYWSAPQEYSEPDMTELTPAFGYEWTLPNSPIKSGSLQFTYNSLTVTDNGNGGLTGVNGTVDYELGLIKIYPINLPAAAGEITMNLSDVEYDGDVAETLIGGNNLATGADGQTMTYTLTITPSPDSLYLGNIVYKLPAISGYSDLEYTVDVSPQYNFGGIQNLVGISAKQTFTRGEAGESQPQYTFKIYPETAGLHVGSYDPATKELLLYGTISNIKVKVITEIVTTNKTRSHITTTTSSQTVSISLKSGQTIPASGNSAVWQGLTQSAILLNSNQIPGTTETEKTMKASLKLNFLGSDEILLNAAMLNIGGEVLYVKNQVIYKDYNSVTGMGTIAGGISAEGDLYLSSAYTAEKPNVVVIKSFVQKISDNYATEVTLRVPAAPLRPASFYIEATDVENNFISATADVNGDLIATKIAGKVNANNGIANMRFGAYVSPKANYISETWYSEENVVGDTVWRPLMVLADTIKYNAVAYTYLPLDAEFIGLDATRLPQDGRVPIFKDGYIAVIHNSQEKTEVTLVASQTINLSRTNISAVDLYDANGEYITNVNYSVNLATGIVTMADPLDLGAFTAPFKFIHRIEDMALLSDVQINGTLYTVAPITHSYLADGNTYVSSVLKFGDIKARVYNYFHQETWTSVWSNDRIGSDTTAKYNYYNYPLLTTNKGAITERWAAIVTSSGGTPSTTKFKVVGEKMGYVTDAVGNSEWFMNQDCSPQNPATLTPFFTIDADGWGGAGFSVNNVLRFNTEGGCRPIEFIRTTLQGPATENNDCFRIQIRGDAD